MRKLNSKQARTLYVFLAIGGLLLGSFNLGTYFTIGYNTSSTTQRGSFATTASYIIFKSGSMFHAINGRTGEVTSSSDKDSLVQSAIDSLTAGGLIYVKRGVGELNANPPSNVMLVSEEDNRVLWGYGDVTEAEEFVQRYFNGSLREVLLALQANTSIWSSYHKVGLLVNIVSNASGNSIWAFNPVVQVGGSFDGDAYGIEIDVNNDVIGQVKGVGLGFSGVGSQDALAAILIARHQNNWAYGITIRNSTEPIWIIPKTATSNVFVVRDLADSSTVLRILGNGDMIHGTGDLWVGSEVDGRKVIFYNWGESKKSPIVTRRVDYVQSGYNVPITTGSTSVTINLPQQESDANYGINVTTNWNTTVWVTNKGVRSFTVNFNSAPAGASVDWFLFRTEPP